ncbi:MAG TPA: Ppx/GppA phosphatase family protein [Bacteroidota bacterium]|nr:Ppx/GppA phosphatase family protein [Bacteroidota bacterium]
MKNQKKNLAAIDVGTNSLHLLVAEVSPESGNFKILEREKEIVRLGSGSTDMKYLAGNAVERAIHALRRFRMIADSYHASIRAIATSAVREALNQDEFLRLVKTEAGIKIEVASGFEEARLIHLGVLQALPIFKKRHLMLDIGGGSTEFLFGYQRNILYTNSLKIGAVRLTQRFFEDGVASSKSIRDCRQYVRGMLSPIARAARKNSYEVAVGTSGTITNIAHIIRLRRDEESESSINNFTFTDDEVSEVAERILERHDPDDRTEIDGLDPARADIVVAGVIILEEAFRALGIKRMTISEYALREGIILDTIEKFHRKKKFDHFHDIRYTSVLHIAESFGYEKEHAHQVSRLALDIFDQTAPLHKLGESERVYLEAAALLHEVGLFVSHAQHHRHSYYLIRNSELLGFTENEKEIIANVARYHRKSHPKMKHEGYSRLSADERDVVMKLASMLRIADGLDRTHFSVIKSLRCKRTRSAVLFKLRRSHKAKIELEVWGANRKKELFEKAFRVKVRFSPAA